MSNIPEPPSPDLVAFQAQRVRGKGHIVLFVDDEQDTLNSLKRLFNRDYTVWTARNATEGMKLLTDNPTADVCAVFSDQRMPEGNHAGVTLLAGARQLHPIATRVLMTAFTDFGGLVEGINEAHVYAYIAKPWIPEEFDKTLAECVARAVLFRTFRVTDPADLIADAIAVSDATEGVKNANPPTG